MTHYLIFEFNKIITMNLAVLINNILANEFIGDGNGPTNLGQRKIFNPLNLVEHQGGNQIDLLG